VQFSLFYRGDLKANRGAAEKHDLRRHFHVQLAELWKHLPLSDNREFLASPTQQGKVSVVQEIGAFKFAPLVTKNLDMTAELEIVMLRPGSPGSVITHGGDIDNRLKTLLDALKIPSEPTALPSGALPGPDETPFFTLLEDDRLLTGISVRTDRLLDANAGQSEVLLLIRVTTRASRATFANLGLSG